MLDLRFRIATFYAPCMSFNRPSHVPARGDVFGLKAGMGRVQLERSQGRALRGSSSASHSIASLVAARRRHAPCIYREANSPDVGLSMALVTSSTVANTRLQTAAHAPEETAPEPDKSALCQISRRMSAHLMVRSESLRAKPPTRGPNLEEPKRLVVCDTTTRVRAALQSYRSK